MHGLFNYVLNNYLACVHALAWKLILIRQEQLETHLRSIFTPSPSCLVHVNLVMFLYALYTICLVCICIMYMGLDCVCNMALCCFFFYLFADLRDTSNRMIIMLIIAMYPCDTGVCSVALYEKG